MKYAAFSEYKHSGVVGEGLEMHERFLKGFGGFGVMDGEGWQTRQLCELADIRISNVDKKFYDSEKPVKLCNYMDVYANEYVTGNIQFMEASATPAEIERFSLNCGDVIITKDSETPDDIGVPAVITEEINDLVCGYHLALIRPNQECLNPVYLAKQLCTSDMVRYFAIKASGSTRFGLSIRTIETVEIPTPPKPEQTKIAEILSTVDRAIEQTEAIIAKQQRIKTGLMQDLLTRGIDEHGSIRSEATHEFKDSPLGRIPVEWGVGGFENYVMSEAGIKPGPFGSSLTKDMYVEEGYRVYGQEQVIGGTLNIGDYFITGRKYSEMGGFAVEEGDVLISLVGTIGHVLIVPHRHHPGVINPRLLRFRPDPRHYMPQFLKVLLLSQPVRLQLDTFATGGTMPVLSGGIIRKLRVVILGLNEQKRIIQMIAGSEAALLSSSTHLAKLRSLKTALMQDLLTGKKRVTALLHDMEVVHG